MLTKGLNGIRPQSFSSTIQIAISSRWFIIVHIKMSGYLSLCSELNFWFHIYISSLPLNFLLKREIYEKYTASKAYGSFFLAPFIEIFFASTNTSTSHYTFEQIALSSNVTYHLLVGWNWILKFFSTLRQTSLISNSVKICSSSRVAFYLLKDGIGTTYGCLRSWKCNITFWK
jgi:hypothetical protein